MLTKLARFKARGFDRTTHVPFTNGYHVRCSQCAAVCVNGVACHERGCPNETRECKGCDARIPTWQEWCEDCRRVSAV